MFYSRAIRRPDLALDRATARTYDGDGRMHVAVSNISKAAVNGYLGREIPEWQQLGLDAERLYQLLRDPDELAKPDTIRSFNNLPVLSRHVPVDARDHRPDLVVGSSGTDARFVRPYLQNSIVIWSAEAIDGVESGEQRELSSAYRYRCIMGAGNFGGVHYDGRMANIIGNHIALVCEGRAGADVVVADAMPTFHGRSSDADFAKRFPHAARIRIS